MNILDSRFYAIVDRLSNLFILNLFWILSCLPIVTIGPATSAMFCVVRQWKLHQDSSVVRNYFHYFKENFMQSLKVGIIWMLFAALLYLNYFYLNQDKVELRIFMIVPLGIVSILFIVTSAFLFSVISHYKVTLKGAIKSSFFLALANFPITLLILGVLAALVAILLYLPATSLIIFSTGALINYSLCNRVFQKMDQMGETDSKISGELSKKSFN